MSIDGSELYTSSYICLFELEKPSEKDGRSKHLNLNIQVKGDNFLTEKNGDIGMGVTDLLKKQ